MKKEEKASTASIIIAVLAIIISLATIIFNFSIR